MAQPLTYRDALMTDDEYKRLMSKVPQTSAQFAVQIAQTKEARSVENGQWLAIPRTKEFLQQLESQRIDYINAAKAFALSGDNVKCAIKMVEVATIDNNINTAKLNA